MVFRTYTKPVAVRPLKDGARVESYVCEEDVLQGQVVKPGGTNEDEIEPSATDGENAVGVAMFDQSSGGVVDVIRRGTVRLTDGTGSITANDPLASHGGTGEEGEVASAASGDHVFGVARFDGEGDGSDVIADVDFVDSGAVYGGAP